ncbi:MAG: DUF58 domain-containing protein [Acidobacteria bacterium]|nr:DUF58 domain-containing protein [Acidobacteriota bacterium]
MLNRLRGKKSFNFVLISGLLTGAAILAAMISAVAEQIGEYDLATLSSKAALGLALIIVLYVIPRLARSVRLEYLHSEYSLHIPNAGLVFLALILLVTVLALTSGNNLLYLVLAVLLATMFISWIVSRTSISRMNVSVNYPDHIFAGEAVPFDVVATNLKRFLPSFSVIAAMSETVGRESGGRIAWLGYFSIIPPGTRVRCRVERVFPERGLFPVRGIIVASGFPFGFIEQRRFIEFSTEHIVYPKLQPLEEFEQALFVTQGRVESHLKGSGSDLYAIRQYLSDDHHRHIDWKATAKTSHLMVREFTRDDDWKVTIAFDRRVPRDLFESHGFKEKFERAVNLTASLIDYFINDGAEVRLLTLDEDSGYGIGRLHTYAMLRQLAPVEAQIIDGQSKVSDEDAALNVLETELSVQMPGQEQTVFLIATGAYSGGLGYHPAGTVQDILIEDA